MQIERGPLTLSIHDGKALVNGLDTEEKPDEENTDEFSILNMSDKEDPFTTG